MARWFSIYFLILVLIASTSSIGIFDNFLKSVLNMSYLKLGVFKYLIDLFGYNEHELDDMILTNEQEFDFIVVGAGSAGATVAARLTELEKAKVLLVEAGGRESLFMDIPFLAVGIQLYSPSNWGYLTEKSDNYCRGAENNQCKVAKGKIMGGTSVLNFMIATRGNKADYNEWAQMTGDETWSYNEMLKYFKKLEDFNSSTSKTESQYHGTDGPIHISQLSYRTPLIEAFVNAGTEMGFPPTDYNGRIQRGFSYLQCNIKNGERISTNRGYLHPIKKRKNLFVSMHSHVTKVLIDPSTMTATGVEFVKNREKIRINAKKEVIMAAGAISTPQILMLSGIGPANDLKQHNINVLKDLPVGENLMDHVAYGGLTFLINETVSIIPRDFLQPSNPSITEYFDTKTGPLSTPGGVEGIGYVNVDNFDSDEPNIELLFAAISLLSDSLIHVPFGLTKEQFNVFADKLHHHSWLILPVLMKPKSRGKILLNSSDPFEHPKILANYFADPDDLRVFIKGIRMAIEVSKTKSMQRFDSQFLNRTVAGCELHDPDSDTYWECALRTLTITLWHHSGTCKMGRDSDQTAVVNTKLQVIGIKNLRVVDASIMPSIVRAHTNIPVIAVAEKAADLIESDWKNDFI